MVSKVKIKRAVHAPPLITLSILAAITIAFVDESIRKILPGNPVFITGIKDIFLIVTALLILSRFRPARNSIIIYTPWALYVLFSSFFVYIESGSLLHLLVSIKVYTGFILMFAVGVYLGKMNTLRSKAIKIFMVGAIITALVGLTQEFARGMLPTFLSTKIFDKVSHSLAGGGEYVESLFASPQTFAVCMVVATLGLITNLNMTPTTTKRRLLILTAILLFSFGAYFSRIRIALLLLALGLIFLIYILDNGHRVRIIKRITFIASIVGILSLIFTIFHSGGDSGTYNDEVLQDTGFYSDLISQDKVSSRISYAFNSLNLNAENAFFGYGAGTSGVTRKLLANPALFGPGGYDSGIEMTFYQFGFIGILLFFYPIIRINWYCITMAKRVHKLETDVVWSTIISLIFLIWFSLKANSVLENSFQQIMWFVITGICYGICIRETKSMHRHHR